MLAHHAPEPAQQVNTAFEPDERIGVAHLKSLRQLHGRQALQAHAVGA
jgi:hypothetical protein